MVLKTGVVTVIVFSSVLFNIATGIRCYDCNSVNNSMCIDPTKYDRETIDNYLTSVECREGVVMASNHNFFCRKIVQTLLHKNHDSEVRVVRGCGWVRAHRDCYTADNEDHLETVCQCFQDHCNGAPTLAAPWGLLVPVYIAASKWWIWN